MIRFSYITTLIIGAIIGLIVWNRISYPVTLKVCEPDYKNCSSIAKFTDRADCETTSERWGWRCDSSDKQNITCTPDNNTFAVGFCD